MILGRCLEGYWWKAVIVISIFGAFVSFGFGYTTHVGGEHLHLSGPSLRPGPLAWYTGRAAAANARIERIAGQLAMPGMIRSEPDAVDLDEYYVASALQPLFDKHAQIGCPLTPAAVSFPTGGSPQIRLSDGLLQVALPQYPILLCCRSASGLILDSTPSSSPTLATAVRDFCAAAWR